MSAFHLLNSLGHTRVKNLADLATLFLENRKIQVEHAQTIAENTQAIANSLLVERDTKRHLAETNYVSAEEVHEVGALYASAQENAANNRLSHEMAKIELEDAKRDLEAVQH